MPRIVLKLKPVIPISSSLQSDSTSAGAAIRLVGTPFSAGWSPSIDEPFDPLSPGTIFSSLITSPRIRLRSKWPTKRQRLELSCSELRGCLTQICEFTHKIAGKLGETAPTKCSLWLVNLLPLNDLAAIRRTVAPVLKGVKTFLFNNLTA